MRPTCFLCLNSPKPGKIFQLGGVNLIVSHVGLLLESPSGFFHTN